MFENELREHLNEQTQVVTPVETYSGILIAVTSATVTVRVSSYPGYGNTEDVFIGMDTIAYVRFFE